MIMSWCYWDKNIQFQVFWKGEGVIHLTPILQNICESFLSLNNLFLWIFPYKLKIGNYPGVWEPGFANQMTCTVPEKPLFNLRTATSNYTHNKHKLRIVKQWRKKLDLTAVIKKLSLYWIDCDYVMECSGMSSSPQSKLFRSITGPVFHGPWVINC